MVVRNFYVEGRIDGRQTVLTGGPRGKEGGMDLTITIRENGVISKKSVTIQCNASPTGELTVDVHVNNGVRRSSQIITQR